MERFLVFAGTTEGRRALELLFGGGHELWASVATEYGGACMPELPGIHVLSGRLGAEDIRKLLVREHFTCVLDATHPFAREATENIRAACTETGTEYVRVLRDAQNGTEGDAVRVESAEAAARFLAQQTQGNILLTTGSKELAVFARAPGLLARLYARVLPAQASMEQCLALGLPAKQVICMQGPFTAELNAAMLLQTGAKWLVTKETGVAGGFPEKCAGAARAGARVVVLARPEEYGVALSELAAWLHKRFPIVPSGEASHGGIEATPCGCAELSLAAEGQLHGGAEAPACGCAEFAEGQLHSGTSGQPCGCAGALPLAPEHAPHGPLASGHCTPYFPLFISLAGKTAVVLGGGKIAARRALALTEFGCAVRVIAPDICAALENACAPVKLLRRRYACGDCAGAALVVAATNERETNAAVARECAALGVPVSTADCKEESTFYFPGLVSSGGITVGVTASGKNHSLARKATERIRAEATRLFGAEGEE